MKFVVIMRIVWDVYNLIILIEKKANKTREDADVFHWTMFFRRNLEG